MGTTERTEGVEGTLAVGGGTTDETEEEGTHEVDMTQGFCFYDNDGTRPKGFCFCNNDGTNGNFFFSFFGRDGETYGGDEGGSGARFGGRIGGRGKLAFFFFGYFWILDFWCKV